MGLIFKIAWRNLWRHKNHSLVIGTILCLGALIMTVGNGVVEGMDRGLQKTIVHGFTGDLVLVSEKYESDNVFLEMMGKTVPPIDNFKAIRASLEKSSLVDQILPMGKNMAMVLNEDGGMPTFLYLLGVDFERYHRMFPDNVNVIEGRFPKPGRPWLMLPTGARKEINDMTNVWFIPEDASLDTSHLEAEAKKHPGDLSVKSNLVLMGFNEDNSSTDIRLNVAGVFKYRALNTIFHPFALMDIESYRQTLGYFMASEKKPGNVSARDSALFAEDGNLDNLFSGDSLIVGNKPASEAKVDWIPKEASQRSNIDMDDGAYNLVLVLLHSGVNAEKTKGALNKIFRDENLGIRAVDWKQALGPVGSMTTLIKSALFIFVSILFLVAVIIIVNTLSMAALERTPEIGMMRAIGARKGFIGLMFLAETAALSLAFGGLGIVLGAVVVELLSLLKLASENDMLQLFFGGDTFRPVLTTGDIGLAFLQLGFVTAAAVIYPLILARSITPLDAVYKE